MVYADKVLKKDALMKVRQALYDAKLALESDFDGDDKRRVIRTIIEALDTTSQLEDHEP